MNVPAPMLRKLMFIRIAKGDAEEVGETLAWGADPNWTTRKGTPAIVRAVRGDSISASVVRLLLDAGADPNVPDATGLTALGHVRRRLLKYDGRPRRPIRRSPSLTPGGELRLSPEEWEFIDEIEAEHPGEGEAYLAQRRKIAERVYDTRGELEKMLEMLEELERGR